MAIYFVDTSALCKRYVAEAGSGWVREILHPTSGCITFVARITAVEIIAAITRRERGGSLATADADTARNAAAGRVSRGGKQKHVDAHLGNDPVSRG